MEADGFQFLLLLVSGGLSSDDLPCILMDGRWWDGEARVQTDSLAILQNFIELSARLAVFHDCLDKYNSK